MSCHRHHHLGPFSLLIVGLGLIFWYSAKLMAYLIFWTFAVPVWIGIAIARYRRSHPHLA